jgi:hypothetical protein
VLTNCAHIPPGFTEAEVLAAIDRVSTVLAPAFVFGFFTVEDIRQQARLFALEVLAKGQYKPGQALDGYLFSAVRNKLRNYKRDLHHRSDPPCQKCATGDFCCQSGPCKVFVAWVARNQTKANLARPVDMGDVPPDREPRTSEESVVEQAAEGNELEQLIDERLPLELRADYLKMRAGVHPGDRRREPVQRAILAILAEAGLSPENFDTSASQ